MLTVPLLTPSLVSILFPGAWLTEVVIDRAETRQTT